MHLTHRAGVATKSLLLSFAAALPVCVFLIIAATIASQHWSLTLVLGICSVIFCVMLWGNVVVRALPGVLHPDIRIAAELIAGVAALSVVMLGCVFIFGISAAPALLIAASVAFSVLVFTASPEDTGQNFSFSNFAALGVSGGLSFIWSWQAILLYPRLQTDHVFRAWQDFVFHGAMVTQFSKFAELDGSWIFAKGTSLPIYHYGTYMLPAAIQALSGMPALIASTALLMPLSFMIMGAGVWTFGYTLAGRSGALFASAAVFAAPSAAYYGLAKPYFDFHWLMQVHPAAHVVGFSLLALTLLYSSLQQRSSKPLVTAIALVVVSAFFKAQFFALLSLSSLFIGAVLWQPKDPKLKVAALSGVIVLAAAAVGLAELLPRAPHFLSSGFGAGPSLKWFLGSSTLDSKLPSVLALPANCILLLFAAFGLFLPAYFGFVLLLSKPSRFDFVPALLVLAYLVIVLTFPRNTLDEFQHRPFGLVYAILAAWCGIALARLLARTSGKYDSVIAISTCILLLAGPLWMQQKAQSGLGPLAKLANWPMPAGLLQSSEYIRDHSSYRDVVQSSSDDGEVAYFGWLTSLSERASYVLLLKTDRAWKLWGSPLDIILQRQLRSKELLNSKSYEDLEAIALSAGIDWYVVSPDDRLPDGIEQKAVFRSEGYRVFRFNKAG